MEQKSTEFSELKLLFLEIILDRKVKMFLPEASIVVQKIPKISK